MDRRGELRRRITDCPRVLKDPGVVQRLGEVVELFKMNVRISYDFLPQAPHCGGGRVSDYGKDQGPNSLPEGGLVCFGRFFITQEILTDVSVKIVPAKWATQTKSLKLNGGPFDRKNREHRNWGRDQTPKEKVDLRRTA